MAGTMTQSLNRTKFIIITDIIETNSLNTTQDRTFRVAAFFINNTESETNNTRNLFIYYPDDNTHMKISPSLCSKLKVAKLESKIEN